MEIGTPPAARARFASAGIAMVLIAFAAAAIPALAHDAIRGLGGKAIHWNASTVHYIINSSGSKDVADDSDLLALRLAFREWNLALGGALVLEETTSAKTASMNVDDPSTHRVVFDINDSTGYFPASTGIVALTPIHYNASNAIVDADIIFNNRDHVFSTSLESVTFDVRDVATHEIGHFIGLDHSPLPSASLYPYVDFQQTAHRSLSEDDVLGARAVYDNNNPELGRISGFIYKQNGAGAAGAPLRGADVVARHADGRTAAGTISRQNGFFEITLPPDQYTIEIAPLDGPAGAGSFVSNFNADLDFGATIAGGLASPLAWTVLAGGSTNAGALVVDAAGPAGIVDIGPDTPIHTIPGLAVQSYIYGSGFAAGTQLLNPAPLLYFMNTGVVSGGSFLTAEIHDDGAPAGSYDLISVSPSGAVAVEPGAIDVRKDAPTILQINPSIAAIAGGDTITITGDGFVVATAGGAAALGAGDGTRIVVGDRLANVNVLSPTMLTIECPPGAAPEKADVIVINPDGQESRLANAFKWYAQPKANSVFPQCVSASGGAVLRVGGDEFYNNANITFVAAPGTGDSVAVAGAQTVSPTALDAVAPAMPVGNYDITITFDGGEASSLSKALRVVADPDPIINDFVPGAAPLSGGTKVKILGGGFVIGARVLFNADIHSGTGGVEAPVVTYISDSELSVVAPPGPAGAASVLIILPDGQAAGSLGFAYGASGAAGAQDSPGGHGGGGGGCAAAAAFFAADAPPPFAIIVGYLPFLLALAWAAARWRPIPAARAGGRRYHWQRCPPKPQLILHLI
ncbi:MAG: IPT/TIG domain-containing protein [Planctomycetes bacterium]|nr:IPT/TIG domain-containing protein [Planctomycetota bacterium]